MYREDVMIIGGTILAIVLALFLLVGVVNYAEFVDAEPRIEQLRADLANAPPGTNEDIYGQASDWNQTIKANQRWNAVPLVQAIIPNGWDDVQVLSIQ